ncbi:MAG: HAD hydrolase-like protein [Planctomycetota bacterium]
MFSHRSPYAPIEGTARAPRGLFVKRWGTLLVAPAAGLPGHPDELEYVAGAIDALYRAGRAGWKIYLIGNEEPVWKGEVSVDRWRSLQERIHADLHRAGVTVVRDYACIDHPDGVAGRQSDSVYLLPNTGPFFQASHFDGIELAESWVIGDATVDMTAAWRAGLRTAGVSTGHGLADGAYDVETQLTGASLTAVIDDLLSLVAAAR